MRSKLKSRGKNIINRLSKRQKSEKTDYFHTIHKVPKNFGKVPWMRSLLDFRIKIMFLDENWVEKLPNTKKLMSNIKNQGILKISGFNFSRFKSLTRPQKVPKNIKNMMYKLFFKTLSQKNPLTKILSFRAVTRDGNLLRKRENPRFKAFFTKE